MNKEKKLLAYAQYGERVKPSAGREGKCVSPSTTYRRWT